MSKETRPRDYSKREKDRLDLIEEMAEKAIEMFHNGMAKGQQFGEQVGEAKTQMNLGMKALCLATAIREAQKTESVSQYVLCEVLIDLLANECGGRLDAYDEQDATPN